MDYDDLHRLVGYGLSVIEFYNEDEQLEYVVDLDKMTLLDVDVVLSSTREPLGIIKLIRDEESKTKKESV
jgi:hypothetical protein